MVHYDFFLNYESVSTNLASLRPGKKVGDPTVTDIRRLQYLPNGGINYNLDYDSKWIPLPQRKPIINGINIPPKLYGSRIPITKSKFEQLQELKPVIEREHHDFYNNLPHIEDAKAKKLKTK